MGICAWQLRKGCLTFYESINHCNIDNVAILFFRKSRPLERLAVVCSGSLLVYMGRRRLGWALRPNPLGVQVAALPILRINICFFDGRSHTAKAAPNQAGSGRASPSEKRR